RELVRMVDRFADDPSVAAARAVPGGGLLDEDDRGRGIELPEEERGPKPGEAAADDRDVRLDVSNERLRRGSRPRGHPVAGGVDRGERALIPSPPCGVRG